ncbi:MAG TPA: redoxin domain-containing protein [Methylomirabilota bacterium]|nr:redoxin domain-containing protein [Methylomirabilota bacterium]
MTTVDTRPPVAPGEAAPDFSLPAVDGSKDVTLADYRGKNPVFLALMVGLWCPFCRRQIARLGTTEAKLKAEGVETVCVVATAPENARLYFKFRPSRLRLGADPALTTHRAFRVPKPVAGPEFFKEMESVLINPTGELPKPLPVMEAAAKVGELDGHVNSPADQADMERQFPQLKARYLIDRDGIVRWASIECANGPGEVGSFPSDEEILAAVRGLPR